MAYYNIINPFLILVTEGIFELIMATFYSINSSLFKEIIKQYEQNSSGNFILFIFLLILYLIFSAALNAYKIYCNVIYSPMARSITDYLMNLFLIYIIL